VAVTVRKGMPSAELDRETFAQRFRARFHDPQFANRQDDIERLLDAAWEIYKQHRKAPRTQPAGQGYADPSYELSVEWLATRDAVHAAEARQTDANAPSRVLVINGSSRSDQTCPGEMSKTYRLARIAEDTIADHPGFEVDFLDLSHLTSERDRIIYPCKACVSTAMPLCHWPCSCYPNHSLGQVNDWMNELYPRWVAAHGVMILCPVNWYQVPSPLKLMIDRLVCADGGNPDPSSTHGKDPERAKAIELAGWDYPRHLAGRVFSVVVHGDSEGVDEVRRLLHDWLANMRLVPAGKLAQVGSYIGYEKPYATSHDDLDADDAVQEEVRNAARAIVAGVALMRRNMLERPDAGLIEPRQK
jgi:multimeric flavodoxin WrbA